jgi:CheY-like chemotaxis protein
MNRCAIAEIDEFEQIKASIKVLRVEDNLSNFRIWAKWFRKFNLVTYYGLDVEIVMQIAANKQVDIIIVKPTYSGKYREVNWRENIRMLKSNPETAQIPVILKLSNGIMVGDQERYLAESGADDAIRLNPGSMNPLVEKIQDTLSANNSSQNTTINLKNRVTDYRPVKIQK